jgi:hypothetical protein
MTAARELLRTLCDVEGVIGSFLLSNTGGLVATDLPATFDAAAFAEAGPRIVRLAELGGSFDEETRFFVIRFDDYKLYVRVLRGALLGVLLTPATSMPALRAASGVVARRAETLLVAEAARGPDTVPAPPRFEPERASSGPSLTKTLPSITRPEPEPPPSKRSVKYRGRSV